MAGEKKEISEKSALVEREEQTLAFWRENHIFKKTLLKTSPKGEFVFYEGPPTANGKPGIHHLLPRAFKDAIPRYKTMQGFHVRRKSGWDTHGLAVEIQTEKELGLKSKKEIEAYGIEAFNKKCRESVWRYVKEWEAFTERTGYWVDLKNPYITYKPEYIESVWNIVSKINERKLLYKDYKVVPWCPRCGTGLSSHELAQGYEDVKDLSVTTKFKVTSEKFKSKNGEETYLLAWTTTPWTLPGNVGLAVGEKITYQILESEGAQYILAKDRVTSVFKDKTFTIVKDVSGTELVGLEYEPLYPFLKDNLSAIEKLKLPNAFKVYPADFVTTTDGTGIVHTAVMYGTDDFELGTKVGLPKHHLVKEDGTFKDEVGFLAGKFVKDPETDISVIKDLASRGLLFSKEKYSHSYPHCWRCHTPLIYFARDSWYIKMSSLRDDMMKENEKINWEPSYIKDGRFGEWLKDIKDWAISRERYWGTPLPIWECTSCKKIEVVGSFSDLFSRNTDKRLTKLILLRHGESEKNVLNIFDNERDTYALTKAGEKKAAEAGEKIKGSGGADAVYASPVLRTRQTAEIVAATLGKKVELADELWEVNSGEWNGMKDGAVDERADRVAYNALSAKDFYNAPRGVSGESWQDVENRTKKFVEKILKEHAGETAVIVSHEGPLMTILRNLRDMSVESVVNVWEGERTSHPDLFGGYSEPLEIFVDVKTNKEIDPHRPFIDDFTFACDCGGEMKRVREVMDVWFDSGAMPFAQEHYPFSVAGRARVDGAGFPADFISEAIDQTRGWFYTLHAIGTLLGKGKAYKNVICLGHILDAHGKKMSKSVGNVVDPNLMIEKYGADPLRFWMYSINQPGEPKNFDEKTVDEIVKKVFNLAGNVLAFYQLYVGEKNSTSGNKKPEVKNVLDQWILAKLDVLISEMTKSLDGYQLLEPTRAVRDFIADLSQWYLRRSRERFKGDDEEDKNSALQTTAFVLETLAKLMAPFTPFFSEYLYEAVGGEKESVHLESWPEVSSKLQVTSSKVLEEMEEVRKVVSLGLEQRAKSGIKVRQPLQTLKVKSEKLKSAENALIALVEDEMNVKEVVFDSGISGEVELDTVVTAELKEEGSVREFVRAVQELRKTSGLNPGEPATLVIDTDEKTKNLLSKYEKELSRATQLKKINYEAVAEGTEVSLDGAVVKIAISR